MEVGTLNAKLRPSVGTGHSRKLRQTGLIPAICYGHGQDPIQLQISPSELQKALDPKKGRNTLLRLNIDGHQGGPVSVLLKDAQHGKIKNELVHADFLRVRMDRPVRTIVPLTLIGKAEGVKEGGTLHQVYRSLSLMSLPDKIPTHVEIDITSLKVGQSIHVTDLKLPEGTKAALAGTTTLCVVTAPKADKASETAETAVEGAPAGDKAAASAKTPAPDAKAGGDKAAKPAAKK